MKKAVSISTALLLAVSLAACGSNDDNADQNNGGDTGSQTSSDNSMGSEPSGGDSMQGGSGDTGQSGSDAMSGGQSMQEGDSAQGNGDTADQSNPKAATAELKGTKGNEDVSATVQFKAEGDGVSYTTQAKGLKAGKHGYHIHVNGDCSSPDGKSAGTHFNLQGSSENPPKDIQRITGNLGNLDAGDDGSAKDDGKLANASLSGDKGLIGHSVIIHAKPNDASQPPIGAAGARQACGVIKAAQPES